MKTPHSLLKAYEADVELNYQLYNSLFVTLPFAGLEAIGAELPLFAEYCQKALKRKLSSVEIIEGYFAEVQHDQRFVTQKHTLLLFVQFLKHLK